MFIPIMNDTGCPTPWEELPCSAITPKMGMLLKESSGNLAKASGTDVPAYISMVEKDSACTAGDLIPVIRIEPGNIYETTLSASGSALKIGDKVTVATDGLRVTATTTSGVAEIMAFMTAEQASGDAVRVRF